MLRNPLQLAILTGSLTFGAASAVLALMGLGVPFIVAALGASACVALVLHEATRRAAPAQQARDERAARAERVAALRHDLRGVLSPALMVADRLTSSHDPAIRRAGETVVRSIERATDLLAANKAEDLAATPEAAAAAALPQAR